MTKTTQILCLFLWSLFRAHSVSAQNGIFFKDSKNNTFYDSGLAFFTSPSSIKQVNGDKLPVSTVHVNEGQNSLEINWKSVDGGDWSALVIAPGFLSQDITEKDTLFFYAYSPTELPETALPNIFMEGAPGVTKSKKYDLGQFLPGGLPESMWVPIKIPLSTFLDDPTQTRIDFENTKAIIFGQNAADNVERTLYVDFVATLKGDLSSPPIMPDGLSAKGYERHVELRWNKIQNSESKIVDVFRQKEDEPDFIKIGESKDSIYIDYTGESGLNSSFKYRLRSRSLTGNTSDFSTTIEASTEDMTDDQLLDMVQEYTFRYFWEFAHPISGLAYERNTSISSETVTTGGSGFGIMAIPVGIERGFITRKQGIGRIIKILNFLNNSDRFHGAWPHWLNGTTGRVIPFFREDNGGDLVETSFLIQGLLTIHEYFSGNTSEEEEIRDLISTLWEGVEWDWYRKQSTEGHLTWHWSPNFEWQINHALHGWNEVLITYFLSIASTSHGIPATLFDTGWARNGAIKNGREKYGITLPLGSSNGGPLFFTHYSFLGLDPNRFGDQYVDNYYEQGVAQSLINQAYCIDNPGNFEGYSEQCWGLTASDNPDGYLAHEPDPARDNGTITPTAALSSMPYTPRESLAALKHFYRVQGKNLWGIMGFYDSFNLSRDWFASSYLAIDQGPIILMIENYRTGLLWDNFMNHEAVKKGVQEIDGLLTDLQGINTEYRPSIYPNPSHQQEVKVVLPFNAKILEVLTIDGKKQIFTVEEVNRKESSKEVWLKLYNDNPGVYLLKFYTLNEEQTLKLIIQ